MGRAEDRANISFRLLMQTDRMEGKEDLPVVAMVIYGFDLNIAREMSDNWLRVRSRAKRGKCLRNANSTTRTQRVLGDKVICIIEKYHTQK